MAKDHVVVRLTRLQAACLLQLAEEADLDTFASDGEGRAFQRMRAGTAAISILQGAIVREERR